MSGMIDVGQGYQRSAMSGMARLSQQEQERETANKQLENQKTQQLWSTGASAAGMIATIALLAL